MNKYLKRAIATLSICLTLFSSTVPASAAQPDSDAISPLYAVPIDVACVCNVSEDSELFITCTYGAALGSGVTRVDITVYVEKRNLLVLWDRVDINQPNEEWTTICYGLENDVYHSVSLSSGTYRVTSIFEVYKGTTLVETIEKTTNSFTC